MLINDVQRPERLQLGRLSRDELHFYDMRGTAATELLRAGCSLEEIATTMGWGIRHAGNIIEKYVALAPEKSDEVLLKSADARKRARDGM
ncbi:hypothetical protein [Falsiruegeria mediterranea]